MDFKPFDYEQPPSRGLYWLRFNHPEMDCDADSEGRTIGWATGVILRKETLAYLDPRERDGLKFELDMVDSDFPTLSLDEASIESYRPVYVPEHPAGRFFTSFTHYQASDVDLQSNQGLQWVAFSRPDGSKHVTLARKADSDDLAVDGYENPYNVSFPLVELVPGDLITHIMPFDDYTADPVASAVSIRARTEPFVQVGATVLQSLYDIAVGRLEHVNNGMCPDKLEGYETRDDECPACLALIQAEAALKDSITPVARS